VLSCSWFHFMPNNALLFVLGILGWSLLVVGCHRQNEIALQPAEESVHLGRLSQNQSVKHIFAIKNGGDTPINIVDLRTSCSCTVPGSLRGLEEGLLPSNGTLFIPVVLHTGSRKGFLSADVVVFYEQIGSNTINALQLTLTGEIRADVAIAPETVDFGEVSDLASFPIVEEVEFLPLRDGIRFKGVRSSSELVKVSTSRSSRADAPKGTMLLSVEIDPQDVRKHGSIQETISVLSTSHSVPEFRCKVKAQLHESVSIHPRAVILRTDKG
jgi:hypothetical protein